MAKPEPKIVINVPLSESDHRRIEREERTWNGTRLLLLSIVTLALSLALLYFMANTTSLTYWDDWLMPGFSFR
jgi:hypothetical protein